MVTAHQLRFSCKGEEFSKRHREVCPPTRSPVPPPQSQKEKASFPFILATLTALRLASINMRTGSITARLIGVVDDRYYVPWVKGKNVVERTRRNDKVEWMIMKEQMLVYAGMDNKHL